VREAIKKDTEVPSRSEAPASQLRPGAEQKRGTRASPAMGPRVAQRGIPAQTHISAGGKDGLPFCG
jgi:hypothetical protein